MSLLEQQAVNRVGFQFQSSKNYVNRVCFSLDIRLKSLVVTEFNADGLAHQRTQHISRYKVQTHGHCAEAGPKFHGLFSFLFSTPWTLHQHFMINLDFWSYRGSRIESRIWDMQVKTWQICFETVSSLKIQIWSIHFSKKDGCFCQYGGKYRICPNKRPGRLIFHPSKPIGFVYSPPMKTTHQNPSVLCTPPFEKSPIKAHRFCVLPPLKDHPSKTIGFVYSPLWKLTHQNPSVLCTPPFEKSQFLAGAYFGVSVYFGKYGVFINERPLALSKWKHNNAEMSAHWLENAKNTKHIWLCDVQSVVYHWQPSLTD